jgi:hypothetical protein
MQQRLAQAQAPARPPRRNSRGEGSLVAGANTYALPPGAAPPSVGSNSDLAGQGFEADEPPSFQQFASPLTGLPPLLAPQLGMSSSPSTSRKLPPTAAIQSEFQHRTQPRAMRSLTTVTTVANFNQTNRQRDDEHGYVSPNSAPPTHSTFAIDLTNAPPLPPLVQYHSPVSPTNGGKPAFLRQSSRKGSGSPVKQPHSQQNTPPEPVTVYSRTSPTPPSSFGNAGRRAMSPILTNTSGSPLLEAPPRSSSRQGSPSPSPSYRSVSESSSRNNSYNNSTAAQPSIHVIASSHPIPARRPSATPSGSVPGSRSTSAGSAVTNKDLPRLNIANTAAPPRSGSPLNPNANMVTSPTVMSPTLELPRRGASLAARPGMDSAEGMASQMEPQLRQPRPLPSVIQGQALNSFSLGSRQTTPDPVAMMENLHMAPESRSTPPPSAGTDAEGSILNRPKPKPKSSAYRSSPSRSPAPPSDGFQPPSYSEARTLSSRQGPQGTTGLERIMMEDAVQAAMLPHLLISSFLALMTTLEKDTRHAISGELVGRWVTASWGMELGPRDVHQWPGLGVWEGFRKWKLQRPVECPADDGVMISGIAVTQRRGVQHVSGSFQAAAATSLSVLFARCLALTDTACRGISFDPAFCVRRGADVGCGRDAQVDVELESCQRCTLSAGSGWRCWRKLGIGVSTEARTKSGKAGRVGHARAVRCTEESGRRSRDHCSAANTADQLAPSST